MSVISRQVALKRAQDLLKQMTLDEKIGQMAQVNGADGDTPADLCDAIRNGRIGSIINEVVPQAVAKFQSIAINESRLGIPLLIGRDVIHGFKTIFPIPLGQAATWDPDIVKNGARIAAIEASQIGVNWTFAPMIDIARDPRWGRIAESLGEDPVLCSELGKAMVEGFQNNNLTDSNSIAATAKHFVGYGASESGRDYNTTNIPENELRNVHARPFKAVSDAGAATFMTSFSDLNGVPPSANKWLLDTLLRHEWGFAGFVVSDWASIHELMAHGIAADEKHAAQLAAHAGVDMEMATHCYRDHLAELVEEGVITEAQIDAMVLRILALKFELGLFDQHPFQPTDTPLWLSDEFRQQAKVAAQKSCVLLKNEHDTLPINPNAESHILVIGPLADDGHEQLGTWIFDGEAKHSETCLAGINEVVSECVNVEFIKAMETSRSHHITHLDEIKIKALAADVIIAFVGEESILSGEAHCRTNIDLPGAQNALLKELSQYNAPLVAVVLAGRPLTLEPVLDDVDALLYAWHPGTMGGPAIAELLFGLHSPSGKTPVSFPRNVGQIPIYYNRKNTGRPPSEAAYIHQDEFEVRAPQISPGMASTYLDTHYLPLFPFGYGLSYSRFAYSHLALSSHQLMPGENLTVSVMVANTGRHDAEEIVQLYIRDRVGSVTRPVKELKGFERRFLKRGESCEYSFVLTSADLAFYDIDQKLNAEPGWFDVWVGPNSAEGLHAQFELLRSTH